jgi:serine/threonine-protein kinase
MTMAEANHCPLCGAELPADAPDGLCPQCGAADANDSNNPDESSSAPTLRFPSPGESSTAPTLLTPAGHVPTPTTVPGPTLGYFGGYELLEKIAQGGMGVVYRARQTSLNRVVALKMILAGQLASEVQVQRFRHEAELAAALRHPNIVAIHEVGEHYGQHYFSMEYVEGRSLADLAQEGPLPPRRAATYVRTIAEAIQYAHERGTLHRDLKPSNVLIDRTDRPRITDFGLAKRVDAADNLTVTGAVMGTPSYMSPEQASGSRHRQVGPASDVYSLGAILYELLVGRPPFEAEGRLDIMLQVIEVEPTPPRKLQRGVPRDLETICLKCMAKNPEKRYSSAGELAADLDRWLDGEAILARSPGPIGRALRWARRRPALAATFVALALFYANYLFSQHFFPDPYKGREYGRFVVELVLVWFVGAAVFQHMAHRPGAGVAVMYGWGALDVVLLTLMLLAADGPRSALLVVYLLLVAVAMLRFRASVVWLVAALCMAGYLATLVDAYARRPWLTPAPDAVLPFLLSLALMAIIVHLAASRIRVPPLEPHADESVEETVAAFRPAPEKDTGRTRLG